jgi:pimeloyl-ACP methyl ester carboxylesterase
VTTLFASARRRLFLLLALAFTVVLGLSLTAATHAEAGGTQAAKPTIVFVHGAFADASGFGESIKTLQKMGYTTYAPANPLRGLTGDTDYLRTFLGTLSGPIVLVGHSYGGAVITNAATGNPNIKALVYIAAYALDEGEAVADANGLGGGTSDLLANVDFRPYPGAPTLPNGQPDQDAYIKQASFQKIFAADVPNAEAAVMAATQRPATLVSLLTPHPAARVPAAWAATAAAGTRSRTAVRRSSNEAPIRSGVHRRPLHHSGPGRPRRPDDLRRQRPQPARRPHPTDHSRHSIFCPGSDPCGTSRDCRFLCHQMPRVTWDLIASSRR